MIALQKNLNALIVLTITGILIAAFGVQFIKHEKPCPLCLLQRTMMIGVAVSALLNIHFGIKPAHYALGLLCSLAGGVVALRQIALHVCPGFPEFGVPVLGMSLYTWSFLIFACCVLAIALLLLMYNPYEEDRKPSSTGLGQLASLLIFLVAVGNIFATLNQCGLTACSE